MNDQFIKRFPKGLEIQLSENFSLQEYECKCSDCDDTLVSMAHVARLEHIRRRLGAPLRINSGYRCPHHNAAVGGVPGSQHVLGTATDLAIVGVDKLALTAVFPGVILYDNFTHVDSRSTPIFLDNRLKK